MQHVSNAQHAMDVNFETNDQNTIDDVDAVDEECTETRDPVSKVFSIPELFIPILSHIPIKDLARALPVSKHWNQAILEAVQLQRSLFRTFRTRKLYLRRDESGLQSVPIFTCESSESTKLIVEAHPALMRLWWEYEPDDIIDSGSNRIIVIPLPLLAEIEVVPASTLLFQPPLETISMNCLETRWTRVLERSGGLTFGDLIEAYKQVPVWDGGQEDTHPANDPTYEGCMYLLSEEAVLNVSKGVVDVEEALSRLDNTQS